MGAWTTVQPSSGLGLLCHLSQVKSRLSQHLVQPSAIKTRRLWSDHGVVWVLHATEVSIHLPVPGQRSRIWQDAHLSNQTRWSDRCHPSVPGTRCGGTLSCLSNGSTSICGVKNSQSCQKMPRKYKPGPQSRSTSLCLSSRSCPPLRPHSKTTTDLLSAPLRENPF